MVPEHDPRARGGADDWDSYRLLVLDRGERLETGLAGVQKELRGIRADITGLKVKVAVWSASIATVGSIVANQIFGRH